MNNHTDNHGNPYDRHFFNDASYMRQQMNPYGMQHNPLLSPQHYMNQQDTYGFTRRSFSSSNPQQSRFENSGNLPSPSSLPAASALSNPWAISFSPTSSLNNDFSAGISPMLATRWSQDHSTVLPTQRSMNMFSSLQQESQLQGMPEREVHFHKSNEQLQKQREAHMQHEVRMQREAQLQREIQMHRETQMQREAHLHRESQLHRESFYEHTMKAEREKEALLLKERDEELKHKQEHESQMQNRNYFVRMQEEQQALLEKERTAQTIHEHNLAYRDAFTRHGNSNIHSPMDIQSTKDFNILSYDQRTHLSWSDLNKESNIALSSSLSSGNNSSSPLDIKSVFNSNIDDAKINLSNSHTLFPQSTQSSCEENMDEIPISLAVSDSMKKNQYLEDNLVSDFDLPRDRNLNDTPTSAYPKLDDIDLSLDNHIQAISDEMNSPFKLGLKSGSDNSDRECAPMAKKDLINDEYFPNYENFEEKKQCYKAESHPTQIPFSQSYETQNSISEINTPIHSTYQKNQLLGNTTISTRQDSMRFKDDYLSITTEGSDAAIVNPLDGNASSHHKISTSSMGSPPTATKKPTISSFSSIESFLGMNSEVQDEPKKSNVGSPDALLKHDRISVIKPLAVAEEEGNVTTVAKDHKTNKKKQVCNTNNKKMDEYKMINTSVLPIHPSMRLKKNQRKTSSSNPPSPNTPEHRPMHPSVRLKKTAQVSPDNDNNCLPVKPVQYQFDMVKSSVSKTPTGGKPLNYPVPGGKPTNYSMLGGKPSSYTAAHTFTKDSVHEDKKPPTGGKPLSFLKSICDERKSLENIKERERNNAKERPKQENSVQPKKAIPINRSSGSLGSKEKSKKVSRGSSQLFSNSEKSNVGIEKVTEKANEVESINTFTSTPLPPQKASGKPFHFKEITFNGESTQEEDSESGSGSSSSESSSESDNESIESSQPPIDAGESGSETCEKNSQNEPLKGIAGTKRKREPSNSDVISALKKRKIVDEEMIKVPLRCGWRRQTRLRPTPTGEGLRGDVYYYSPCGKKLRTYPELNTYMLKNEIEDVSLQNFSFSTKLKVGDFLEAKQGSKLEKLSEEQINERFNTITARDRLTKERLKEKNDKKKALLDKAKKNQEEKMQKKLEREAEKKQREEERRRVVQEKALEAKRKKEEEREAARIAKKQKADAILTIKMEKKAALEASKIAKREKVENMLAEKQRQKEEREKERLAKLEEQRLKKEMRLQVIENQREKKKHQSEKSKATDKEQRKRDAIMMKAYETQRKAEERERLREQKKLEKMLLRQRKLEQKRYEKLIARELKKPIDDMALTDMKPLPNLPLIPNLNVSGQAFADLLMVEEFVHTFGHVLDIDVNSEFPSMAELHSSLLCESTNEDALFNACQALLFFALYDPGVNEKYASTKLGVSLQNVELNENNISEVLRLFILGRNDGKSHVLSDQLYQKPLISLSPSHKAAVLAFLCNEILCGKTVGNNIENHLENMSTLRRNKWTLEGEMRKLKTDICKLKPKVNDDAKNAEDEGEKCDTEREIEEEKDFNLDGDESSQAIDSQDEESRVETGVNDYESLNIEQMEKKLKQTEKKHSKMRDDLFESSHAIRGVHLGQDRYRRRYFILSHAAGVFVEGLESGYFDENAHNQTDTERKEVKEKIGTLITTLKSPTLSQTDGGQHVNDIEDKKFDDMTKYSTVAVETSTEVDSVVKKEIKTIKSGKWFSLQAKCACDSIKGCQALQTKPNSASQGVDVRPPTVKTLGDDHKFLESIYSHYSQLPGPGLLSTNSRLGLSRGTTLDTCTLFGLPPELDINLLIQQDPQKAAEILEIQTTVPQDIPSEMKLGWWQMTELEHIQKVAKAAHPRGMRERALQKAVSRNTDYIITACKRNMSAFSLVLPEDEIVEKTETREEKSPVKNGVEITDQWYPQLAYASDKAVLIEVEELEEKVFSASLQVKGWRLSQKTSTNVQLDLSSGYQPSEEEHPLNIAIARLLALEAGVERRYLKHPFRNEKQAAVETSTKEDGLKNSNVQLITPALRLWREAVSEATSAAQLSMCISMLCDCVAWDKSIMKVFCILCRKSDNEERLLLCDACDRGCHTYCCKPKLEKIPEGDWFCQDCILMASGSDQCYKCKEKSGKRIKCAFCPRYYHLGCLEPPLQKTPRSPWACPVCKKARLKAKTVTRKQPRVGDVMKQVETPKAKSGSGRKRTFKDMEPCRQILNELENHSCAWPFLVPVNPKQFPEYYKIIRNPMDFHTMKTKLRDNSYKSRDEFVHDARRVFINCNTFNEDESEVGQAGKMMSKFFEKRWRTIIEMFEKKGEEDKLNTSFEKMATSSDDESSSSEISSESESSILEESEEENKK